MSKVRTRCAGCSSRWGDGHGEGTGGTVGVMAGELAPNHDPWQQLLEGVHLPFHPDLRVPELHQVALPVPQPAALADVAAAARQQVVAVLGAAVTPGMTVAVGAGSRGLTDRVELLRGTIDAFLPTHEVFVTDWVDARLVPLSEGRFDLDDYIAYVISMAQLLGPDVHLMGVCQPSVPVIAAIALPKVEH